MIVVDASVMVDALIDDGKGGDLAQAALTADSHWVAPGYFPVEVTSAIRGRWLGDNLAAARADAAVLALDRLTVTYASWREIADRVWELRHNLNPYDAGYVALAEAHGCPLITADRKLLDRSAGRCRVEVITGDEPPEP